MSFPAHPLVSLALAGSDAGPIAGPDLWRYFLVSSAMVALVVAIGWVLRRFVAASLRSRAAARSLQVIEVLPLGGRQKLAVVRVYDRTLVVGLGEKEVSLVAELDGVPVRAEVAPPRKPASEPLLRGALGAFERLRARVGEALPRNHGAEVPPARTDVVTAKRPAAAPVASVSTGRLGNGRGLLG